MRGDGRREFQDGVPILVVNGQPVEMAQVGAVFQKKRINHGWNKYSSGRTDALPAITDYRRLQ